MNNDKEKDAAKQETPLTKFKALNRARQEKAMQSLEWIEENEADDKYIRENAPALGTRMADVFTALCDGELNQQFPMSTWQVIADSLEEMRASHDVGFTDYYYIEAVVTAMVKRHPSLYDHITSLADGMIGRIKANGGTFRET